MRKRLLSIITITALAATALVGCGKKSDSSDVTEELKEGVEYVITTDNVKVAQYKGLSIDGYNENVSDEEIDEFIDYVLQYVYTPETETAAADANAEAEEGEATDEATDETVSVDTALTHEDLTDDLVVEISDGQYSNIADYREYVKTTIAEQNKSYFIENAKTQLFQQVNDSVLLEYSDEDLQSYIDYANEYYAEYAEYLGVDLETFYKDNMGYETEDDFNNFIKDEALTNLKTEYIILAIADAEGIEISDEDVEAEVQKYITDGYFSTVDEVEDYITRDEIGVNLRYYQILDIIFDSAEIVPYEEAASSDLPEDPAAEATEATEATNEETTETTEEVVEETTETVED